VASPNPAETTPVQDNLIIVIDDDEIMRLSCEQILRKSGYRIETYSNGQAGIRRLREIRSPLLIVDIKMPELDGFEVIKIVRNLDPDLSIVVITGYATIETAVDAMKAGAYDFLPKPFTPGELRMIVQRGFERWRLIKEAQRLRREKEDAERKFVTLVSHQLKTPLVAVKQYLDVMVYSLQGQRPEKGMEWIARSRFASARCSRSSRTGWRSPRSNAAATAIAAPPPVSGRSWTPSCRINANCPALPPSPSTLPCLPICRRCPATVSASACW